MHAAFINLCAGASFERGERNIAAIAAFLSFCLQEKNKDTGIHVFAGCIGRICNSKAGMH
jgi:hypothetical protein